MLAAGTGSAPQGAGPVSHRGLFAKRPIARGSMGGGGGSRVAATVAAPRASCTGQRRRRVAGSSRRGAAPQTPHWPPVHYEAETALQGRAERNRDRDDKSTGAHRTEGDGRGAPGDPSPRRVTCTRISRRPASPALRRPRPIRQPSSPTGAGGEGAPSLLGGTRARARRFFIPGILYARQHYA